MATRGQAKVRTTVSDCRAAAHWLSSYVRSKPQGTILTGPPDTREWARLANLLATKAYRRRRPGSFDLTIDRELLIEFQRDYAPTQFARRQFSSALVYGVDRFAGAVDLAMLGKVGRPRLTRHDRQTRLVNPAPCYAVGERQQKRLRRVDRLETQLRQDAAGRGTILVPR